jgi:hypothetical protein
VGDRTHGIGYLANSTLLQLPLCSVIVSSRPSTTHEIRSSPSEQNSIAFNFRNPSCVLYFQILFLWQMRSVASETRKCGRQHGSRCVLLSFSLVAVSVLDPNGTSSETEPFYV